MNMETIDKLTGTDSFEYFKDIVSWRSDPSEVDAVAKDPERNLDRTALVQACNSLRSSDLAPALLHAVLHGDTTLVECLWGLRGPFRTDIVSTTHDCYELNGEKYNFPDIGGELFPSVRSIDQLKRMIDLINDTGITGLIDGAGAIFCNSRKYRIGLLARSVVFEGELPTLSCEYLRSPELLVALNDASKGSRFSNAYDPILCWATPEMVGAYGEFLDPFIPEHGAIVEGKFVGFESWRECHAKNLADEREPSECNGIILSTRAEKNNDFGQVVMQSHGSNLLQHGIFKKEGYLLCHTSSRFLAEFDRVEVLDAENYLAAKSFASLYVPFDIMTLHAHPGMDKNTPTEFGFRSLRGTPWNLDFLNLGEDIHKCLGPVLSHDQWKFIMRGESLEGRDVVTAVNQFGLDNLGMVWKLNLETPAELKAIGYRFPEGTRVLIDDTAGNSYKASRRASSPCVDIMDIKKFCKGNGRPDALRAKSILQDLYDLGIWPFKAEKTSLPAMISSLARKKNPCEDLSEEACIARIKILEAGVVDCILHARKPKEWIVIADIHGAEAIKPYVEKIPLNARGRVFALELGM